MEKFLFEVFRIELAAQKNAARFGEVRLLDQNRRRDKSFRAAREEAKTLVLRSQCNDAYWHGVFGGLYSPHLRTALWRSLVQVEASADAIAHRGRHYATVESIDFNADGREEYLYFCSERYAAILSPDDGATISALDCRQSNSLHWLTRSVAGRSPITQVENILLRRTPRAFSRSTNKRARKKRVSKDFFSTTAGRRMHFD